MNIHAKNATRFIADENRTDWHDASLWGVRKKRDRAAQSVKEWEQLRALASQIKEHTLSRLDEYLIQFEAKAKANGAHVHWANNAAEHNHIVASILKKKKAKKVVKSKSMLTEECHLNQYLEKKGIEIIDTDLGERIIQLKNEPPSHIVMPAIHLKKEEIGALFHEKLNTKKGATDPKYLTEAARQHLRKKFLAADAAITGVNFGIAETGGVVICTNEGNADMGLHSADLQIHCMGIEKIIPQVMHLGIFTRILARSATGQPITIYTSHCHRPRPGTEMHIVILDNGRSEHLGKKDFRNGLKCIRCGACMNTCPVYRRSGGHSYHATVPGPIGSILNPNTNLKEYSDLPFASSLCGSCSDVCPVKIDIHDQLYKWRQIIQKNQKGYSVKNSALKYVGKVLSNPKAYGRNSKIMRAAMKYLPGFIFKNKMNTWSIGRELPVPPKETFKEWYKKNRKHGQE